MATVIESALNPEFGAKVYCNGYCLMQLTTDKAYSIDELRSMGVDEQVIDELTTKARNEYYRING